jgi:hypothetical protein
MFTPQGGNTKQNIPELFLEIMRHANTEPPIPVPVPDVPLPFAVWKRWKVKHDVWKQRQRQLITAAEKALSWNTDKGSLE